MRAVCIPTIVCLMLTPVLLSAQKPKELPESTLGAKPPEGAVVLFDGSDTAQWVMSKDESACKWVLEDGAMEVRGGDILSKQKFGDFMVHVEFRIPYPKDGQTGQHRGNSGVFLQNRYEIQVLDSWGLEPGPGDCGAIYGQKPPMVNAALPPGEWQTYDIEYRAPRFDENGRKIENARVTVYWNGKLVHDNAEIVRPTRSGDELELPGEHPLRLQDHGHPVRYRNIWVVPR